jgi:hypothetical protein
MTKAPPIVLRYFDARGRAQFVRHCFACRGIEHVDERVALSPKFEAWQAIRGDRAVAGPFHKLPVLHWGNSCIAETSVIYSFLHRATGDEALLSEEENLRHTMLFSSLYNDVMMPSRLYHEAPGRPVFEQLIASRAAPVTGRGLVSEGEMLATIRGLIAA